MQVIQEALETVEKHILPSAESLENKVLLESLRAEYLQHLAEIATGMKRKQLVEKAFRGHKTASELAQQNLLTCHPALLRSHLKLAKFYQEVGDHFQHIILFSHLFLEPLLASI